MKKEYSLRISDCRRETPLAVSIAFEVPEELRETFRFRAGQYLTLETNIEGVAVRRAYSICSAPHSGELRVAIKEVPNGVFSTHANRTLKAGDTLTVFPPEGRFVFDSDDSRRIGAFAAGSGITPILSIAETVLNSHPDNQFVLLYGNKTKSDTLFYEALQSLQSEYTSRFSFYEIYSREHPQGALFGRIDSGTVRHVCKSDVDTFDAFYLCGPEPMIHTVKDTLLDMGVAETNILFELFTPTEPTHNVVSTNQNTQVTVTLDEETIEYEMRSEKTLLEAALAQKIDAPYSCQGGVCMSCIARIVEGSAEMVQNQILTDQEIADGLVLTCQAHPTSDSIHINFDDV
jgi:ring-1,2-phenylacetyl-CoA epoxidase subunit PaaE